MCLTVTLTVVSVPSFAQEDEAAALDQKVLDLSLRRAGKYSEALPLAQQALALQEKAHGPDDPDVADFMFTLASVDTDQLRYSDAEPLLRRVLVIREGWTIDMAPLVVLARIYESHSRYIRGSDRHPGSAD